MNPLLTLLIIFLCMFDGPIMASELIKITRVDNRDSIQLYFSFDRPPLFNETANEKRINLIFPQSKIAPDLQIFEADDKIVKILSQHKDGVYILSLFFRYKPQNYKFSKSADEKIVLEVLLGNRFSKSYKNLADRLKGLTILDRNSSDYSNPYVLSPYSRDWISFFSKYESPLDLDIPLQFSFPPFPIIQLLPAGKESNLQLLSPEMFKLADKGLWAQLAPLILKKLQTEPDIVQQKLLALIYSEVLVRGNDFEEAFKQLHLLKEKQPEEPIEDLIIYLLALTQAIHADPHLADLEFKELEERISTGNPLAPYLLNSQIETTLATSQYSRMNKLLLRDDIGFPDQVKEIRAIRQGDYWFAIKQPVKAYVAYNLLSESVLLPTRPYSLNRYCTTLYNNKKFEESAACYEQLSSLALSEDSLGLVKYRLNMARLKFQNGTSLVSDFTQIENAFSGSEAGYRAALKKNDLFLLQDNSRYNWALKQYEAISQKSILRTVTEEALFKQALIYTLLGQSDKSIALLQKLLRDFRQGDIKPTAQALLIEVLPGEIKRLVDKKEYLKGLVLAKQNKELFKKRWIDSVYLADIAEAYQKIGIFDEAQQLYLYLIEIVPIDKKEQFYLPMIKASFNHGNYSLVDDYAAQYTYNYPRGSFSDEILLLRLQALVAEGRLAEAHRILPTPLPDHRGIIRLAGSLFYRTDNFKDCTRVYDILADSNYSFSPIDRIMYGESLFRTEHFFQAEDMFLQVTRDNPFFNQSLYRLAELERRKGKEKNGLRFFRKIVETGRDDRWKQYAEKELQFADAASRM